MTQVASSELTPGNLAPADAGLRAPGSTKSVDKKPAASASVGIEPERISRRQVDKFAERRAQLAESALLTLSELGYARTSLREIAQNSAFSHGVLHYYFRDKVDLITHCVREYKARCVTRYDQIVAMATTADELRVGFAAGLAQTMVEDAHLHRLWYDLRSQSMFEASFREDVAAIDASLERMIWRIVSQYADLMGAAPTLAPATAYAIFDGLFQHSLIQQLSGSGSAAGQLREQVEVMLPTMAAPIAVDTTI